MDRETFKELSSRIGLSESDQGAVLDELTPSQLAQLKDLDELVETAERFQEKKAGTLSDLFAEKSPPGREISALDVASGKASVGEYVKSQGDGGRPRGGLSGLSGVRILPFGNH